MAGIGNIFLGDDAFGVEVIRRMPPSLYGGTAEIRDFGIRGLDLAYALQNGYDALILVDATQQGGRPGTLYLIEPNDSGEPAPPGFGFEPHSLTPSRVIQLARMLGTCPVVRVVGCEPATLEPAGELSPAVQAAVGPAIQMISGLVEEFLGQTGATHDDPAD